MIPEHFDVTVQQLSFDWRDGRSIGEGWEGGMYGREEWDVLEGGMGGRMGGEKQD